MRILGELALAEAVDPGDDGGGRGEIKGQAADGLDQRVEPLGGDADDEDLVDALFPHARVTPRPLTRDQANPISRPSRYTGCPAAHSCARRFFV